MEDLDNLIEKQMKAEANLGFPLKTISVTTSIDKKGNSKEKSRVTRGALPLHPESSRLDLRHSRRF